MPHSRNNKGASAKSSTTNPSLHTIMEEQNQEQNQQQRQQQHQDENENEQQQKQQRQGDDDDNETKTDLIWFREDERWELTWPIWHMLSREERRDLAHKHGYKTIGEFEEYMTLQKTVGVSTLQDTSSNYSQPYDNRFAYPQQRQPNAEGTTSDSPDVASSSYLLSKKRGDDHRLPAATPKTTVEEEEEASEDKALNEKMESECLAAADQLPTDELLAVGGQILMLHDDLLHRIFDYVPVDHYATLALVSPHWKSFTRTEAVYKRLCERLYLKQSQRRTLHVSRFGNSYRTMLEKRPRVRAGGGCYVIKYIKVKPIQRDMWTEVRYHLCMQFVSHRKLQFI